MPLPINVNRMYIHRLEKSSPNWRLRFRHNRKLVHTQTFFDRDYKNSKAKAFTAACIARDAIAERLGADLVSQFQSMSTKSYRYTHDHNKRNTTGVIGVQLALMRGVRYYKASISLEKYKEKVKSFNCEKLGDDVAFQLAVDQRREWLRELKNDKRSR